MKAGEMFDQTVEHAPQRRPQSPHEALSLMDANGDAYYLSIGDGLFNVISHGPEWVCLLRINAEKPYPFWRRWQTMEGRFIIEGDYDPYEKGDFS